MAHITAADANAWLEDTKLTVTTLDADLESQIVAQIFSRLSEVFDTSGWTNDTTTPALIKSIIAMYYVSWYYNRVYSDDADANIYSKLLRGTADQNISGLLSGILVLDGITPVMDVGTPVFFPNDDSSANDPSVDFPSDGGPSFMMGQVF